MIRIKCVLGTVAAAIIAFAQSSMAKAPSSAIGVVVMHGKGGSPAGRVSTLASSLERKGYLVANLEMPWSARREYDVGVDVAESEIEAALASLRAKGANKVFVAGHSQGGLFALGARLPGRLLRFHPAEHRLDSLIAAVPF
jgi:triacylglycerol esterase/lipase EstA (alpha/beta hydrolase family)